MTEPTAVSEPGSRPYAMVIPVTKSADWWALDQEKRAAMMQEHTEATLPYLKTVKRKLYHSSGLNDLGFITYFETSKLEDFHGLILSLEKVKEFQYTRQFGHPTLIGTVKSLDEMIEALAQSRHDGLQCIRSHFFVRCIKRLFKPTPRDQCAAAAQQDR